MNEYERMSALRVERAGGREGEGEDILILF